ncbi:MAG: hypothetical protein HETSPECPRED_006354 [Heterodermia speciosa]|uniref:Uncharacterized protein n=1 Tax=Heterodermia speciosa TaxID=116794 RepID=A0A8H3FID6_9LECA|nr:MAG: hypothetical protein HETSPECPRED_006354 [Heterodermia speciosa]
MAAVRRDTSLPVGFRATEALELAPVLERQATPVLTLRQRFGSRHNLAELGPLESLPETELAFSDSSDASDLLTAPEDVQLDVGWPGVEDSTALAAAQDGHVPAASQLSAPAQQEAALQLPDTKAAEAGIGHLAPTSVHRQNDSLAAAQQALSSSEDQRHDRDQQQDLDLDQDQEQQVNSSQWQLASPSQQLGSRHLGHRPGLRGLQRLQSALSSSRHRGLNEASPKGVHFISPASSAQPADLLEQAMQQPAMATAAGDSAVVSGNDSSSQEAEQANRHRRAPVLSALASSMKRPLGNSLRRRSFRRQASSVSFAPTVSGDSSSDGDTHQRRDTFGQDLISPAAVVSPVLRTVSSVWQAISSMTGRGGEAQPIPAPPYQPARPNSPDDPQTDDLRAEDPSPRAVAGKRRHPAHSAASLWQSAAQKAVHEPAAESRMNTQAASGTAGGVPGRAASRFGGFWGAVAQAAVKQPSQAGPARAPRANALSQEHLALGVQLLLQARRGPTRLDSTKSRVR